MGPLRGGLIAATLLAAGPAWADACAQIRPGWRPGAPATAWTEALALLGTPPSLALLLASALVVRFRHQWGALAVVLLWSLWVSYVALSAPDALRQEAIAQGCIGSPTLFIALVAAICTGMIVYTTGRPARHPDTET